MQFDTELDVLPEISRYGVEERLRAVYQSELFGDGGQFISNSSTVSRASEITLFNVADALHARH